MNDPRSRRFSANARKIGLAPLMGTELQGGWIASGLSEDFQMVYLKKGAFRRKITLEEAQRLALRFRLAALRRR